jgi:hypothetical protein
VIVTKERKQPVGYGPEYDAAWDAMTAKPAYSWGMAPIHHGVFENAWRAALEAAARIVERGGTVSEIRELAVYDETPAVKQGDEDA